MLFTIVLFALAAAGPVFSAPVPSTELTLRQESADAAVERRHDPLSTGAPPHRSKRLVPGWKTPERGQRAKRDDDPLVDGPPPLKPNGPGRIPSLVNPPSPTNTPPPTTTPPPANIPPVTLPPPVDDRVGPAEGPGDSEGDSEGDSGDLEEDPEPPTDDEGSCRRRRR